MSRDLDSVCPIYTGVVEATVFDTRLVEEQIDGAYPWQGPVEFARDHLPPHEGEPPIQPGPPNDLSVDGGLMGGPIVAGDGGFDGISQTRWTPPDLTIGVGPNHIVQTVNSTMDFYDKAGNREFSIVLDNTGNPGFFEEVGSTDFVVDPKVFYDHIHERFMVVAIEGQTPFLDVAVSDDSNPHGIWYKYRVRAEIRVGNATYWIDYPSFGYDADAMYTGGNLFLLSGQGPSTAGIVFRVFQTAPMLVGDPVEFNDFHYADSFSAQAGHHYGNNPAGFYISVENGTSMRIYGIQDPAGDPSLVTTTVPVPAFNPAQRFSAPNNGGTVDPLDGRVFQVHWRNGALYTGHAINVGGVNKARWYEFDTGNWPDSGSVTLSQSGNVDPGDNIHTYFPALAENGAGAVGMVVAQSASNQFVSVQISGRKATDPPGTMSELTQLKIGDRAGNGRWGDYYDIAVDPIDDKTFWIVGQYQNAGGWASWIESFSLTSFNFLYPEGRPERIDPQGGTRMRVEVVGDKDAQPEPGTGMLHYFEDGDWVDVPMESIEDNIYDAVFPSVPCMEELAYYLSAETTDGETFTDPSGAPGRTFTTRALIGFADFFDDNFETDQGWSVANEDVQDGAWQRGVPFGGGDPAPDSDFDGSGSCYVTGNRVFQDVDGGPTRLVTPALDLDGRVVTINYARYFVSGATDRMQVEISADGGGSWTMVENLEPDPEGWVEASFVPTDYVEPTANTLVRFSVADNPNNSFCEAALDAFRVVETLCGEAGCTRDPAWQCDGDVDGDAQVNPVDSGLVQAAFGSTDEGDLCQYDLDCDGQINPVDAGVVQSLFGTCEAPRAVCP
jgi:hypothetical protein